MSAATTKSDAKAAPAIGQHLVVAFLWAAVFAVGLYGSLRAVQYALFPEANPATVVWSAHAGYFWRLWIVGYTSGAAGFIAFLSGRRAPERAARALVPALTIAAVLLVLQVTLLP